MKDLQRLADDMRADATLRDTVAMTLAAGPRGDWSALITRLADLGYRVSATELREKLRSIHRPGTPHGDFIAPWL